MKFKYLFILMFTLICFSHVSLANSKMAYPSTLDQTNIASKNDSESEELGWLITLNKNEINAAKLALKKSHDKKVVAYAKMMIKQHNKNLQEAEDLSKNIDKLPLFKSALVRSLKDKGKKELAMLKPTANQFDQVYISAMVNGHSEALHMIDQFLSNVGPDKKLEIFLNNTRSAVQMHLEKAREIQEK